MLCSECQRPGVSIGKLIYTEIIVQAYLFRFSVTRFMFVVSKGFVLLINAKVNEY